MRVAVLSYNLRSLRDDPEAVARVVRACAPDVLCLQEVPRFGRWRARRDALAAACGMAVLASRRRAGLAVLGGPRVRLLSAEYRLLSWSPPLHRRALALARVRVDGRPLAVASTHLDLAPGARLRHGMEILRLLAACPEPVVLAGDVNETSGGSTWRLLAGGFQDAYAVAPEGGAPTFPARAPRRRIDAVFADRSLRVLGCGVPPDPAGDFPQATDHCPVLARIVLP
ncbi:endonuclease/exonuclease/phosphatase family protein [Actinocorallia populi]|uniref:endonuclease/exonuclease/phosphatase family protein n=1 Tax=Actinocorallia populi TaxID=2079200 RepID=UPI000D08F645|nr:endonuclease/exonuclease/phosphatase family protein [Actinocorallia populi]